MADPEPIAFHSPFVVLCEGEADRAFLRALHDRRALPPFDLPFPIFGLSKGEPRLDGIDGFGNMLRRIAAAGRLDLTLWSRLRGIVMVADAGDSADRTLAKIAGMCGDAGFGAPVAVAQWADSQAPLPPVAALLIPQTSTGSLETLCLRYLRPLHEQVARCLDAYLACIPPHRRSREKQDKAALACLVAAIDRTNPTRALRNDDTFSGSAPLIDVTAPLFTPFADALAALLA